MSIFFKATVILIIAVTLIGCNKCKDVQCFTPPSPILLELKDATTKENLFTNDTYHSDDIIINDGNGNSVSFNFLDENDFNIIQIGGIGWETETVNYTVAISKQFKFVLLVNAERVSLNCCDHTQINELDISNYEFTQDASSEIVSVFIEQ